MADLFFADCVRETSMTSGTGAYVLNGAATGHRRFVDAVPQDALFYYTISGIAHENEWEVGQGSLDPQGRLLRSALSSSNGNDLVAFSTGLKSVSLTVAADWFAAQAALINGQSGDTGLSVAISDVTGLSDVLDGKQEAGDYATADHIHADMVRLSAAGNLGLGVTNPLKRLHIADDNSNEGSLQLGNDGTYFGAVGYNYSSGSIILSTGVEQGAFHGTFQGHFHPGADNVGRCGLSSHRWNVIFSASSVISTSDQRAKQDFSDIPDAWLDAWGEVEWQRYRFTDGTRWHVGLIAQQVHAAFAAYDIDAFAIGLCCFDSWDAERDDNGAILRAAGDRWGLRYDECFAMESAWQRRRFRQFEARLTPQEAG